MTSIVTRELARFVEVKPATGTRRKAWHALVVGVVTIGVLGTIFGVPQALTGFAGIFVAISAFDRSQRSRLRVLTGIALGYTAVVALGALTSLLPVWWAVLAVSALSTITAFGYYALLSDPPGPMLLIMGLCAASYIPSLGVPIPRLVLITALSMVLGCATSVLMQQRSRRAAVQRHVEALRQAVDTLESGLESGLDSGLDNGTPEEELGRERDAAFGALFQAQSSLVASLRRGRHPSPEAQHLEDELHALHLRLFRLVARRELPWAHLDDNAVRDHYVGSPSSRYLLRWALSPASPAWLSAQRIGMAILLAGTVATVSAFSHPYWAQMTAALVLSTPTDRVTSTVRALHRVAGTGAGVLVFFGIHVLHPGPIVVAAIIIICAALTQLLAPRHYALASVVITPMPLLMATMHVAAVSELMWARVLETAIGAVAALLVLWLRGSGSSTLLVRRQFRRALLALRVVLAQMAADASQAASLPARRNLHFEQLAAAKTLSMVGPDFPAALREWDDFEAALGELTYTVLVAARSVDPSDALRWRAMTRALDDVLAGLPPVTSTGIDAAHAAADLRAVLAVGRGRGSDERTVG